MKRFYKEAAATPARGGFTVLLDGKPIRTPAKAPLTVKSKALAEAIAAEWQAQGDTVKPATLHLTRLAGTAIDLVEPRREQVISEIAAYAGTDLVCYRAAQPPELVARQRLAWQDQLDWAAARYAALAVTEGVAPLTQSPEALAAYRRAIAAYDAMTLAALYVATSALGSLVLALALFEGRITADEAFAASQVDETFQVEQWGEDTEAARRRAAIKEDIALAARFVALHRAA
jgi:chaperone required for assembly of F1-ATPase